MRFVTFNADAFHHVGDDLFNCMLHQCDIQGLMVWQDMPSGGNTVGSNWTRWLTYQTIYKRELAALLAGRGNHPSIIQFDLFNEGSGVSFHGESPLPPPANETQAITDAWLAEVTDMVDRSGGGRLIDTCSGCGADGYGDVTDEHRYAHAGWELQIPLYNASALRPSYVGELGGFLMVKKGHDVRAVVLLNCDWLNRGHSVCQSLSIRLSCCGCWRLCAVGAPILATPRRCQAGKYQYVCGHISLGRVSDVRG